MGVRFITGDCRLVLASLPDQSVNCIVTSPPYFGLRDYGVDGQIGLEQTPDAYVAELVAVFREARRVLRDDGTLWLNLGDSYAANQSNNGGYSDKSTLAGFTSPDTKGRRANDATKPRKISHGLKPKDLIGIPWRVAFALQADGWWLRQDIIWAKPNPMPESVTDRCTKAHEYLFMLSKSARYFYDADAIKEKAIYEGRVVRASGADAKNGQKGDFGQTASGFTSHDTIVTDRNKRSVWTVATQPYADAHFATFPPSLIDPCIKAGCPVDGVVLDPFGGAGTTGLVADRLGRDALLIELNPAYVEMARERLRGDAGLFHIAEPLATAGGGQ